MAPIVLADDELVSLENTVLSGSASVSYRIGQRLGAGGMGVALFALRQAPDGESPVVLKILRPSFVKKAGDMAGMTARKESLALAKLNDQVPPTPFVVRLVDSASVDVELDGATTSLAWMAIEFVHG